VNHQRNTNHSSLIGKTPAIWTSPSCEGRSRCLWMHLLAIEDTNIKAWPEMHSNNHLSRHRLIDYCSFIHHMNNNKEMRTCSYHEENPLCNQAIFLTTTIHREHFINLKNLGAKGWHSQKNWSYPFLPPSRPLGQGDFSHHYICLLHRCVLLLIISLRRLSLWFSTRRRHSHFGRFLKLFIQRISCLV